VNKETLGKSPYQPALVYLHSPIRNTEKNNGQYYSPALDKDAYTWGYLKARRKGAVYFMWEFPGEYTLPKNKPVLGALVLKLVYRVPVFAKSSFACHLPSF